MGDSYVNITVAKNVSTEFQCDDSQGDVSMNGQTEQGSYYKAATRQYLKPVIQS